MTLAPLDPTLVRTARLYRLVDHADPAAVRREVARRLKLSRAAGLWTASDPAVEVGDALADGVPVRVYRPAGADGPLPAVLFLHGGAFLSGDLDFEHPRCLEMCRETGAVVVSVDYRLAPEAPYPSGLDDTFAALRWLYTGGVALGVDPSRIAVAGASAGGNLATAACLRARDLGLPLPVLQLLLYPVLDDRLDTPSMRACAATPVWDAPNCAHMWRHYLGGRADVPGYAAPARVEDLSGLPPAYVMTAELDPLCDEGTHYAQRLAAAGVPTELHRYPAAFHGFDTLAASAVSDRARREHYDVLRAAL
jgi:acetyl esterase/lipase